MHKMLVSVERQSYATIDPVKVRRGEFQTRGRGWLVKPVRTFIRSAQPDMLLDPFAGEGHLLQTAASLLPGVRVNGYDIDSSYGFCVNDSLSVVPANPQTLIVTNPPYLAKHSASRKRVRSEVDHYYVASGRDDLYQVALDRCLGVSERVIAIVPETIINSGYPLDRLRVLAIVEADDFTDTDCPVCVCCFGPEVYGREQVDVYRGDKRLGKLGDLEAARLRPLGRVKIRFNDPEGPMALQAVDTIDPSRPIAFMPRDQRRYNASGIKHSSRLVTFLSSPAFDSGNIEDIAARANDRLAVLRRDSCDVVLSPFKGNRRDGRRRRRLDYRTARSLLEIAIVGENPAPDAQLSFWGSDD